MRSSSAGGAPPTGVAAAAVPMVLVVEDDDATGVLFRQIIEDAGYRVQVERSADAALRVTPGLQPAGVVLDLHLEQSDGAEYLRQLRALPGGASVSVAIITGDYLLDESRAGELRALGAAIYFKPVWDEDLRAIVERLVGARPQERAQG